MMNRKGFTLVEAVAAVIIMSVCLTWIMQALAGNLRTASVSQDKAQALVILNNHMEEMLFKTEVEEKSCQEAASQVLPEGKFKIEAVCAPFSETLQRVQIKVRWPSGSSTRGIEAVTIVPQKKI